VTHAPFITEGLNDRGEPSGSFLEVTLVALLDLDGQELGRFVPAQLAELREALWGDGPGIWRLKAIETTGEPRVDLTGDYLCE
jgi:hypothetical protein